jgi:hypothetical protein
VALMRLSHLWEGLAASHGELASPLGLPNRSLLSLRSSQMDQTAEYVPILEIHFSLGKVVHLMIPSTNHGRQLVVGQFTTFTNSTALRVSLARKVSGG